MIKMILRGKATELRDRLKRLYPEARFPLDLPRQLLDYQMLALYGLARQYDKPKAAILEIGTGHGASSLMMALAARRAGITTLTVSLPEAVEAERHWRRYGIKNITPVVQRSWDYRTMAGMTTWDMVFVDGDHNQIKRDMIWWNALKAGGLFLCHDYSPAESAHPCPPVHATLNTFRDRLGRDFDVLIVDDQQTGMAGWYRRAGEVWE